MRDCRVGRRVKIHGKSTRSSQLLTLKQKSKLYVTSRRVSLFDCSHPETTGVLSWKTNTCLQFWPFDIVLLGQGQWYTRSDSDLKTHHWFFWVTMPWTIVHFCLRCAQNDMFPHHCTHLWASSCFVPCCGLSPCVLASGRAHRTGRSSLVQHGS